MNYRPIFVVITLCCAMSGAVAITLGSNTKPAIRGEPLDIPVQAKLDATDDVNKLCLEAEVFYADRLLDKNLVQLAVEKTATAGEALIHITALPPVDGSVVTVHLSGGCAQKTVRRYVVQAAAAPRLGTRAEAPSSAEKALSYEDTLRRLQDQLQQNNATVMQLRGQLEAARGERYLNGIVFALLGVLALAILGLLHLRTQLLAARAALRPVHGTSPGPASRAPPPVTEMASSRFGDLPYLPSVSGAVHSLPADAEPDIDVSRLDRRAAQTSPGALLPARDRARFSVSVPHKLTTTKATVLVDLQRLVDIFGGLGQQDNAVGVLLEHLGKTAVTSALVYLNLFDLYQQSGRAPDYELLRSDFNRVFNGNIPAFGQFDAGGAGLEDCPGLLSKIVSDWPDAAVLETLEEALLTGPHGTAEILSLPSYRELLMLYAVAAELGRQVPQEVSHGAVAAGIDAAMVPRASRRLGLDIDLSEMADGNADPESPGTRDRQLPAARRAGGRRAQAVAGGDDPTEPWISRNSFEPTVLENLVDFDDYDTGFRPEDLETKPR
ncbi:MAG: hypothetical protein ABIP46_12510 [Polaromonas sp.]